MTKPSEYEMKLAVGSRPIPPPRYPWVTGTWTFPFYPTCLASVVWLTLGLTVSGIFLRGIIGS